MFIAFIIMFIHPITLFFSDIEKEKKCAISVETKMTHRYSNLDFQ